MQETFGLTPIEAMACGVPQVVADWDGYRETVVEGETGFRVPTYVADLEGEVERTADLFEPVAVSNSRYSERLLGKCWYSTGLVTPAASAMSSIDVS